MERCTLPLSGAFEFIKPGEKWLMRASTNNFAMTVDLVVVTSRWDFEVEEIVCSGKSWGPRPREKPYLEIASKQEVEERERRFDSYRQSKHLAYLTTMKTKRFVPLHQDHAIISRGEDQLVIVISSREAIPRDGDTGPGDFKVSGAAVGYKIDHMSAWRGPDHGTDRISYYRTTEGQIDEYLERVRRTHDVATSTPASQETPHERESAQDSRPSAPLAWDPYEIYGIDD